MYAQWYHTAILVGEGAETEDTERRTQETAEVQR